MASLSTHVLDVSTGRPVGGLRVTLESADGSVLAEALTDDDGRVGSLAGQLAAEDHVLRFDTGAWFAGHGTTAFYPEVVVTFAVGTDEHYHVPLLLSPFGYSTYRGS
jgi:5-hydroxyisourate hydrolase